jgi:hypothetical protein
MPRIGLAGGSYQARSLAASAQRVLNLYQEAPPPAENAGSPPTFFATAPATYYLTPGLVQLAATTPGVGRGIYQCSQNTDLLYCVIGPNVCSFNSATNTLTVIGQISNLTTPVSIQDNGLVLVITDGTVPVSSGNPAGWYITLGTATLTPISDSSFLGATGIVFLDTFLAFSQPGTSSWYSSPSNYAGNSTPFDPLFIASKSTYPDLLAGMAAVNGLIWLIGGETTEAWYDAGATDFPFQRVPQILIQHGCLAPASIATSDGAVYFLSKEQQGRGVVLVIEGESALRISTYPIEYAISQYGTVVDAIGMTYQQQGHTFYVLTFPTADKTWVYDVSAQLWHERCSLDANGNEHAVLWNGLAFGGVTVALDASAGILYRIDPGVYTDNGMPIKRQRCFAHMLGDGTRIFYRRFIADVAAPSPGAVISLDWSDDRGLTYGTPETLTMQGNFGDSLTWWRLGYARDRVFRLTWTWPAEVAVQGAWIQADSSAS